MRLTMVATVQDTKGKVLGFRFVNPDDKTMKNTQGIKSLRVYTERIEKVISYIKAGGIQFTNIALCKDGNIRGVGGDLSRYTVIDCDTSRVVSDQTWVVLGKLTGGYKLVNHEGIVAVLRAEVVAQKCKLANGKIVDRDGVKSVSSIQGEYEELNPTRPQGVRPQRPSSDAIPGVPDPDVTVPDAITAEKPKVFEAAPSPFAVSEDSFSLNTRFGSEEGIDLADIEDKTRPGHNCDTKMKRALFTLRTWSPLYYTLLSTLKRTVTRKVQTMGVNLTEFVISPDFLAELTEEELMFVLYHEVSHVALGHTIRRGDRDPKQWNIAADLIVNASLAKDMGLSPDKVAEVVGAPQHLIHAIKMPSSVLFNANVDPVNDSVEGIYAELDKAISDAIESRGKDYKRGFEAGRQSGIRAQQEAGEQSKEYQKGCSQGCSAAAHDAAAGSNKQDAYQKGYNDSSRGYPNKCGNSSMTPDEQGAYQKGFDDATNGQAYDFAGSQGGTQSDRDFKDGYEAGYRNVQSAFSKAGEGKQNSSQPGQNSSQSGQNSSQQGTAGDNSQGTSSEFSDGFADGFRSGVQGDGQSGDASSDDNSSGDASDYGSLSSGNVGSISKVTYNFRGQSLSATLISDIDPTNGDSDNNGNDAYGSRGNDELQRAREAVLREKLSSANMAAKKSRGTTSYGSAVERYIKLMTAPYVNWRTLLEKYLERSNEAEITYARPDRRFLWTNNVLPGPKFTDDMLQDLIIAIDTSGSISEQDLGVAASHIMQIFHKYRCNAWVVYWDTECSKPERLKSKNDIRKMKPVGGGGTTVNCFLDWYVKHTRGGPKALNPCAVLVITDGWIERNEEINRVKGGEKFIWLISDHEKYLEFTPPFGKKALYKV